ncbi:MAG: ABC transporter permease subunit/CPBP intramembrane protease [Isosphaeraceae bacterium]|nr:ABC transporter permease subunit/CPBP intramembrane protease [Isosphaeraceae bacterium]
MRLSNIRTIFEKEVRDQVRDKRTLFMVFVLPVLLYPILGLCMLQFTTAFEQKPRLVVMVGAEFLPKTPRLLDDRGKAFLPALFDTPSESARLGVETQPATSEWSHKEFRGAALRDGRADAIVIVPGDVAGRLEKESQSATIPIEYFSTKEQSQVTYLRVREVLARWKEQIVQERLERANKPASFVAPVASQATDVASAVEAGAGLWARLFPFLLVIMALTGAFYPSIDLCAGEKERGTMETLLISPASRAEIVLGKFLTVMLASMLTALFNIVSMAVTGFFLVARAGLGDGAERAVASVMAPPTVAAATWMVLLLIPVAMFFSAVCVALAVLAKSMKEGQYYMTPLYLVSLPLIFLTLMPGIELNLFYSMVPISGVSLLLRSLILGEYDKARQFSLFVLVPTVLYALVALRWAIDQFEREDVLFRESERFDLGLWVRHLIRDREPTPTGGEALFCFAVMISLSWFISLAIGGSGNPLIEMVAGHLGFILLPPVLMALLLTSSPRRTLRLNMPSVGYLVLAALLAPALNPLVRELGAVIDHLFPLPEARRELIQKMTGEIPNLAVGILVFALIPSITEEFAFRGFILSGLRKGQRLRSALFFSAFLFGFMHVLLSVYQQLFPATILGVVLGLLAVRSDSILPGIVFHFINNSLAVVTPALTSSTGGLGRFLFRDATNGLYNPIIVVLSAGVSIVLLGLLFRGLRSRAVE